MHKEYSKQLEKDGITATIVRGGKYKALGNPYEPLNASAKKEIQSRVDHVYGIFVDAVASGRGVSHDEAEDMAQGREFIGEQAVEAGLADKIISFDNLLASLQKKAKPKISPSYNTGATLRGEAAMKRVVLTPERLAAIEAGAAPTEVEQAALAAGDTSGDFTEEQIEAIRAKVEAGTALDDAEQAAYDAIQAESDNSDNEPDAAEQLTAIKAKQKAGETLTDEESAILAAADVGTDSVPTIEGLTLVQATAKLEASQEMVAMLKKDLKETSTDLLKANTKVEQLTAEQEAMQTVHDGFRAITARSIQKMQIALGGSPVTTDTFTAVQLLELHAQVQTEFGKVFKVQGVAVSGDSAASTEQKTGPKANAMHTASIGAARLHSVK